MSFLRLLAVVALAVAAASCGGAGTPTAPTSAVRPAQAVPGTGAPGGSTQVRLVDALAGTPWPGVSTTIASQSLPVSDSDGCAMVTAASAGRYTVSFSAAGIVTRTASLVVPSPQVQLSLIPAGFALPAFDEMFRSRDGRLDRWTAPPRLVVIGREVQFDPHYANDLAVLTGEVVSSERDQLVEDLSYGLGLLTDRQFGSFSGVTAESPAAGSSSTILRTGAIVVARARGLSAATGYWGLGQWATVGDGEVVAGYILLDADFDGPACAYPQFRRSLRIHELGHALGYGHVTLAQSVMNPSARLEPTSWDLQAVRIAFQRLPGSAAPDRDPTPGTASRSGAWSLGPRLY